jgi:Zn-finger nucleic acid-binding protein
MRRFSQEQQRQRIAPYLQLNAAPVARRVQFDRGAMPVINEENNTMELNRPDEYEAVQQPPRPGGSRRKSGRKSRRKKKKKKSIIIKLFNKNSL